MFNFFRRNKEPNETNKSKAAVFNGVMADLQAGQGSFLESALVLHLTEDNEESLNRLVKAFANCGIYTLNNGPEKFADAAVTQTADGISYVAAFSTRKRAVAAAEKWGEYREIRPLSALELLYALSDGSGIVINPTEEHLQWTIFPRNAAALRELFAESYVFTEGSFYTISARGVYQVAKVLKTDTGGVHIRIYANVWPQRPDDITDDVLSLSNSEDGPPRAYGHLPVSRRSFLAMGPMMVATGTVEDKELEGYKLWQEANGGYFGS